MDPQAQELIEKLKVANNVLVTVSSNPSVDQLAAAIGVTIFLNKMNKHATAVFSGEVPSTIEFLKPEETLEKTTDSLRDFIIALDKSKADKLRYKVEENVVKIFITPYKTSITGDDLDFSQGDFNVDVVLCIGVREQQDLDQAITAHGRILHDAVVTSMSTQQSVDIASVNWVNTSSSSLSEMAVTLVDALGREHLDGQIATSLLTGIVAETERFSNDKTSPETMRLSAELMTAGANQQLVASELQAPPQVEAFTEVANEGETLPPEAPVNQDGTLEIEHPEESEQPEAEAETTADVPDATNDAHDNDDAPQTQSDDHAEQPDEPDSSPESANAAAEETVPPETDDLPAPTSRMIMQPPTNGGTLTANTVPEGYSSAPDPLTLLTGSDDQLPTNTPLNTPEPEVPEPTPLILPEVDTTSEVSDAEDAAPEQAPLALPSQDAELQIDASGNLQTPPAEPVEPTIPEATSDTEQPVDKDGGVDEARSAVLDAIHDLPPENLPPEPQKASGASGYLSVQDLDDGSDGSPALLDEQPASGNDQPALPPVLNIPAPDTTPPTSITTDPQAAPPVAPPLPSSAITQIMSQNNAT